MAAASAVALALAGWAVVAHAGTDRPDNDPLDVLAGFPDPGESAVEDHLAWAFDVLNGSDRAAAQVADRLSPEFLDQLDPQEFLAETERIADARPYRLFGIEVDLDETEAGGAALLVDRNETAYALSVVASPRDPSRIDGLLITPIEIGRGPFEADELAIRIVAGLVVVAAGAALVLIDRRRPGAWTLAAGLLCLAQLLELSDDRLAYTVGLSAGPFALAALGVATLVVDTRGSRTRRPRVAAALLAPVAVAAVLPLIAIDTAQVSLPDQLLVIEGDRDLARRLISGSGWVTAVASVGVVLALLLRQFRADWRRDRGLVATTLGGSAAALMVAVVGGSAAIDLGHVDLSQSLLLTVAAVVAAVAMAGTCFWDRYDLGPVAAELEAENTQLHAALEAQLSAVSASRARIVHAGDEARRRLERDLHDGAQQRLVTLRLALQLGRRRFGSSDAELDEFLDGLDRDLDEALAELRELSRGLHPAILERGVAAAAQSLAETSAVPVEIVAADGTRCGTEVEHAAYFVLSEALANAGRHAQATHVVVRVEHADRQLRLTVADDGVGGARAGHGSGLVNLEDRVLALGGSWRLDSPVGVGTSIEVRLPCG